MSFFMCYISATNLKQTKFILKSYTIFYKKLISQFPKKGWILLFLKNP